MGNFNLAQSLLPALARKKSPYDSPDASAAPAPNDPYAAPSQPAPEMPVSAAPVMPIQPSVPADPRIQQLQDVTQQLSDAYAPPQISNRRALLGALVGGITKNPNIGGLITGQTQRMRNIQALSGQQQALIGSLQWQAAIGNLQSESALRSAQAGQIQNQIPITLANGQIVYLDAKNAAGLLGKQESGAAGVQRQQVASRFKAVPGVGLIDTQTEEKVPGTEGLTVTPELQQQYGLPPESVGHPLSQVSPISSLQRVQNQGYTIASGENGPAIVNKRGAAQGQPGAITSLGLGNPGLGHSVQVADPNNPGNTRFTTAGNAINTGAPGPSSASVKVPQRAEINAVPTKIGDQTVAFNTMIQHADLLRQAARALNNGDNQTLSGLRNAFKNEFGYSGPITAQAIADAYNGEVTNVIAKGHITDRELTKTGKTIDPTKQNFQTIDSVLGAYQALAQSKMNMLNKQVKGAVNASQPNQQGTASVDDLIKKYGGR